MKAKEEQLIANLLEKSRVEEEMSTKDENEVLLKTFDKSRIEEKINEDKLLELNK